MRKILAFSVAVSMLVLAAGAAVSAQSKKKTVPKGTTAKSTARKGTASKSAGLASKKKSVARKGTRGAASASSRRKGKKGTARTTWRNRQLAPSPDRYREIQAALAARGYLKPDDATGTWGQNSVDALKKFQSAQNLEATGKINALSLIALGLGPKRETAAVAKPLP